LCTSCPLLDLDRCFGWSAGRVARGQGEMVPLGEGGCGVVGVDGAGRRVVAGVLVRDFVGGWVEAGEVAGGVDGLDGVPVGGVSGVAGSAVGAEDLVRVVGGDLVLVAVGGDDADVVQPVIAAVVVGRYLTEQCCPGGSFPLGGFGEPLDSRGDQVSRVVEVAGQSVV
jgi:hypothetical protein